jgi:glycogen synthase
MTQPWVLRLCLVCGGWLERRLLPRAHAVITLTDKAAGHLAVGGVGAAALHAIPSGVEVSVYRQPHPDPFADIGRPWVVYIGRLAPQKSVHTLIDAFTLLRHSEARLVIIGDGPDRGALEALAARHGLGGRVTFTGFLARAVIPEVLCHTDLLVLPSRCEELGCVLLEGLAAGVPIVASRVGGIPSQADRHDWERLANEVLEVYGTAADRWARRPRKQRASI